MSLKSQYLYTLLQAGAEPALKAELARTHPGLKFSYSRPGFATFKSDLPLGLDFELDSVFARAWGLSLGKAPNWSDLKSAEWVLQTIRRREQLPSARPESEVELPVTTTLEAAGISVARQLPTPGQSVLTAIQVQPEEIWWGVHRHSNSRIPFPGAEFPWPEFDIPSRAYLKIEEAIAWGGLKLNPGEIAMEWGSAPGGACFALLKRGLHVIGVDPGEMDPKVEEEAIRSGLDFLFLRKLAGSLQPHEVPEQINWLFADMNIDPDQTLRLANRWLPELRQRGLRGLALTLKMTDWSFAERLPEVLAHVRKDWGFPWAQMKQLSSHRQEVVLVARE